MSSVSAVNTLLSGTSTTTSSVNISNILASAAGATTPGIDVTSAVAAAIAADRAPETAWNADIATFTSQTTALTAMQTATETLATDMQSLNTLTGPLAARTATSSNTNELTATAATGTVAGVHTVVVTNPATTGSWYSDLQSSASATLSTGTFTITPAGGSPVSIATGSGTTGDNLTDLALAINSATTSTGASLGIKASVVSDASGSRLAIIANNSGTAADFSISTPDFSGTSWTSADMPTGSTLGANSVKLTSSAGTAIIATTTGETYAQLATAINNATIQKSYSSSQTGMDGTAALTPGSVTTIQDKATGNTFTFTAVSGNTLSDLNNAISAAVTAGTLPGNVTGTISSSGAEVIADSSADQGITVTTNDAAFGPMLADPGTPLGLTATAGSNANGSSLRITSSASSFSINEPPIGFTQANPAANAALTVDGVPISSASNIVTGAIPGVTLNVLGTSSGVPITLTVASDASQVSTAINKFVTDYNSALSLVNAQFPYTSSTDSSGTTTGSQGVLASDPTVVALQGALEQATAYVYKPATGTTTISMLSDLGITTNDDGSLSVDSATLNSALTNNPMDVQNFFEGTALNGFANSLYNSLNSYTNPGNGAFKVDLSTISSASAAVTSQINDFETNYIAAQQKELTADFTQAEIALQQLPEQMQQLNAELGFTQTNK